MDECLCCKVAVSAAAYGFDKPYTYRIPDSSRGQIRPGMRVLVPFGRGNTRSEGIVLKVASEPCEGRLKYISALLDEEPVLTEDGIRLAIWMRERYFCSTYDCLKAMLPAGLYYDLEDDYILQSEKLPIDEADAPKGTERIIELLQQSGGKLRRRLLMEAMGQINPSKAIRWLIDRQILRLETSARRGVGDKQEEICSLAVELESAQSQLAKSRSKLSKAVVELLGKTGSASLKDITYFTGARRKTVNQLEKMGLITIFQREVFRRPEMASVTPMPCPSLNEEQQKAYEGIAALLEQEKAACSLLYGVTGSGKTSVYIALIHRVMTQGKSALVLVPEIGLTPQLLEQFTAQFGDQVALLHSSLSAGERYDEWKRVRQGKARVILGTRSAVFAPVHDLGLLILDEEQESSYKSENTPRYHAREVAKYRCSQSGAQLILGSATPSVETMYYAKSGRYHLFQLKSRYNQQAMPQVMIADRKTDLRGGNGDAIGSLLREQIRDNLKQKEQTILFLNRRGTNRMVLCSQCGEAPECPRCSVKLTYHKANGRLMCHYCGHTEPIPDQCPSCGGTLSYVGCGTQKLEEELKEFFPEVPVMRMDADTISASNTHRQMLERFRQERIPILVGTQMVAKGLDFPDVTLVGVVDADLTLYVDDYRGSERTFSLLTQVVGRAGRGDKLGRAVIQTFTPQNETIMTASVQDYDQFYDSEILARQLRNFPPFTELYVITASGQDEAAVLRACIRIKDGLLAWKEQGVLGEIEFDILGPAPAGVVKVNGRYRYRITLMGPDCRQMRQMIGQMMKDANEDKENRGISVYADLNPQD